MKTYNYGLLVNVEKSSLFCALDKAANFLSPRIYMQANEVFDPRKNVLL